MTEILFARLDEIVTLATMNAGLATKQPLSSTLTTLATSTSAFALTLLDDANAATMMGTLGLNKPIVILTTGQSNMVQRLTFTWTPPTNLFKWNWDLVDTHVGTAFAPVVGNSIDMADRIGAIIAEANPTRPVYVINTAFGSQPIFHWMAGAPAPDVYANQKANIEAALSTTLTALGVTGVDYFFWWQGESLSPTPETYVSDFNTVMARYRAETWFPRATPITVFSISPTSISGLTQSDTQNQTLQAVVKEEPDLRRFVYTGSLSSAFWDGTFIHPNANGIFVMGQMAGNVALRGHGSAYWENPLSNKVLNNASAGRHAFRNLIKGGDFTVNPWKNGTTFTSAANGTAITESITWLQSGTGVVDILKDTDAPTIAQAGMYTQNSLTVDVTTADASIVGPDYYGLEMVIPGSNVSFLGFGNAGAQSVAISFWVKHTVVGNYFVSIHNSANDRSYNSMYSQNVTNTWEYKRVVMTGDLSGSWVYTPSGIGLRVRFTVSSSDTYLFSPDVWNAGDVRVGIIQASRANGMSSSANFFKLALVQLEQGEYPSIFDRVKDFRLTDINDMSTLASNFLITPSSLNLRALLLDESGTGALLFAGGNIGAATGTGLVVNGPTSGLGYATGAGGSVTQITSKTTGVTLNTMSGQITTNNAALASSAVANFVVTNSNVAVTDTIILNIKGGITAQSYNYWIDNISAGSFTISLRNLSGGTLSEAVIFNFAIIKAVIT